MSATFSIARASTRPDALVRHDAQCHPRSLAYPAPAIVRAVAHHLDRPGSMVAEWSALALLGLREFSDSADTTLLCSSDTRLTTSALAPTVRRRTKKHITAMVAVGPYSVPVTTHWQTLAGCLRSVRKGEHAWDTVAELGLDDITVMSVQLIDRFRRVFNVSTDDIRVGLKGHFSARELEKYLLLSCGLADSKPETVLRLLAREAVADLPEVTFQSQVPVYTDGTIGKPGEKDADATLLTVFDQADPVLRVGLQQDGEHHLRRSQRDKDAEITADLLETGWLLLRTSTGMLRKTQETKRRVRAAAVAALERRDRRGSL
ncbi:hypothetical protein [Corynebacterium sp.]|uniref:hypothetical protein n=1 Tax=Corynebacterium sp. TaxID=1720 RepID=UPI0026DF5F3D|nr:hypothetical protein [Corynebacterium sp.]MDO5512616.1 hypothetical protein [Corynebacterium sp.]